LVLQRLQLPATTEGTVKAREITQQILQIDRELKQLRASQK